MGKAKVKWYIITKIEGDMNHVITEFYFGHATYMHNSKQFDTCFTRV